MALVGALRRCPPLAVLALRRAGRLASHPARTTSISTIYSWWVLKAHPRRHVIGHEVIPPQQEEHRRARCDALAQRRHQLVPDLLEQGACTLGAFAVCSVMATIALQLGLFPELMDNVARSIVVLMACVPMAGNTVVIANDLDSHLEKAATAVMASTLLAIVAVPAALTLLTFF
jgi:hypothetical protein